MALNNKYLQLLRNKTAYETKSAAIAALNTLAQKVGDGTPLLSRYKYTVGEATLYATILGIVHNINDTTSVTIFEDPSEIEEALEALSAEVQSLTPSSSDKSIVVTNSTGGTDFSVNIDGTTLVKDEETGIISVSSDALSVYEGAEAIFIGEADENNKKTISLILNENEKVLSQNENGLLTTLSLSLEDKTVDETTFKAIVLKGVNDTEVAYVDATDFIKDGFLNSVDVVSTGNTVYLRFVWNTESGKETSLVDMSSLIDLYDIQSNSNFIQVTEGGTGSTLFTLSITDATDITVGEYTQTEYPEYWVSGNTAINSTDSVNTALKTIETNISVIEQVILDNEDVIAQIIADIVSGTGLNADPIEYLVDTNSNYLANATSLANADSILDSKIKENADAIAEIVDSEKTVVVESDENNEHITVTSSVSQDGKTTTYTVNESFDFGTWEDSDLTN